MKQGPNRPARYRWIILGVLVFSGFSIMFCQFQMSSRAAEIMGELNIDAAQFAKISVAPSVFSIFFSVIAGMLADRYGSKRVISISLMLSAIGGVARAFATGFASMFALTLLLGMGTAFLGATRIKVMSAWYGLDVGFAVGVIVGGMNLGTVVAQAVAAYFPSLRAALLVSGLCVAAAALLWVTLGDESPASKPGPVEKKPPATANLKPLLKNRYMWMVSAGGFVLLGAQMVVFSFMPQALIQAKGLNQISAGFISALLSLGVVCGNLFLSPKAFSIKKTNVFGALAAFCSGMAMIGAWVLVMPRILECLLFFIAGSGLGCTVSLVCGAPAMLPGTNQQNMGMSGGILNTLLQGGGFIVPSYIIAPICKTDTGADYRRMCILSAVFILASIAVFLLLPNISKKKTSETSAEAAPVV